MVGMTAVDSRDMCIRTLQVHILSYIQMMCVVGVCMYYVRKRLYILMRRTEHLDLSGWKLNAKNVGFYPIGSQV